LVLVGMEAQRPVNLHRWCFKVLVAVAVAVGQLLSTFLHPLSPARLQLQQAQALTHSVRFVLQQQALLGAIVEALCSKMLLEVLVELGLVARLMCLAVAVAMAQLAPRHQRVV
jgi:hypothetical protein